MELHRARVERERRTGLLRAFAINAGIVLYAAWLVRYLATGDFTGGKGDSPAASFGLAALASLALGGAWTSSRRSAGRMVVERTSALLKSALPPIEGNWLRTPSGVFTLLVLALTLAVGANVTGLSFRELFSSQGMAGARRIFQSLLQPDWTILGVTVEKMMETIFIAFQATLLAVPVAFLLSFPSARNLMRANQAGLALYTALRVVANFTRSVEPIIWAIVFSVWVGIGPFAGMLALMVHSIASLTKLYSEQIENVDTGPIEAIEATGANRIQVIWYGVVPQVVLPFLSFTIYRWDINVRMATILGLVGGGGVGTLLMQYQGLARWNEIGTIVIVIAAVVWAMDYLSAKVREAIY